MALKPQYEHIHDWEFYGSNLMTEYTQSVEEGLDLSAYTDLFTAVSRLPKGEEKKPFADLLFHAVQNAAMRADFPYNEPSDLAAIQALRRPHGYKKKAGAPPADRVHGAWLGRVCGCMLGKTVEGIRTDELLPFLKDTGNYPMTRYIMKSDVTEEIDGKYKFDFIGAKGRKTYPDVIKFAPIDDDTNYVVLAQLLIKKFGRDFEPRHMAEMWIRSQSKNAYCTAERVAFRNFINGYRPPYSAVYKNPYREWIGAQIRGDYFGYINPGNPELAAEMAWRDASISHVKNGIYGEMFAAQVAKYIDSLTQVETGPIKITSMTYTGDANHTEDYLLNSASAVMGQFNSGMSIDECTKYAQELGLNSFYHARNIVNHSKLPDTYSMDISAFSFGDVSGIVVPYEMFDTSGMQIKDGTPFAKTFIVGYAYPGYQGYIPTQLAWENGGYEVETSNYGPGNAEKLVDAYLGMLNELKG